MDKKTCVVICFVFSFPLGDLIWCLFFFVFLMCRDHCVLYWWWYGCGWKYANSVFALFLFFKYCPCLRVYKKVFWACSIVSPRTSLDVKIIYFNLFFEKALPIYVFLYQYCYFKVFFIKGYWKVILIFNILYFYFASILSKFIKDTNVPQSFFRIFRILIANCIKS